MKFLIHSNSPATRTGYGVQTALLAERLHDAGHDVAVSATWGQQGSFGLWKPDNPRNPEGWTKGIRVYPVGWGLNSIDIVHNHAEHWFEGDKHAGWIILLTDVWSLKDNPLLADYNVAAWTPVDHFPAPYCVLEFFEASKAMPVAMSEYGERCLREAGLDPVFVPLAVDTKIYRPSPTIETPEGTMTGRQLLGVPDEPFLVGMVAMNKDPDDRKGFNEAFAAFSQFHAKHPDSVLYVHSDKNGMGTSFNLEELVLLSRIPPHAVKFVDTYSGIQLGWTAEMMAAAYTAFDVLLAPSHGEGFGVPLIEAQACGTPVICSEFSSQPELVGAGWKVQGQQFYEITQKAFYVMPFVDGIVGALEEAYAADMDDLAGVAVLKAAEYDADRVFEDKWRPLLRQMTADPISLPLDRDEPFDVTVIVPVMREENLFRLAESFDRVNDGTAGLCFVFDGDHRDTRYGRVVFTGKDHTTYAEKVNLGLSATETPWVFLCGDDVMFQLGWIEEARKLADRFDVIGTNDSIPPRVRNVDVATGDHADHFFVRRAYVDRYGASLDGPGVLAPEAYAHWYVDKEIIELAKARNAYTPCLTSVVEHLHPGYDGREDLRAADPTYMRAVEHGDSDQETWDTRRPLIEMQRQSRGRR